MTTIPKPATPYPSIRNIELTDILVNSAKFPAWTLWQYNPCLILIIRRPGCQFCREEAMELASHRNKLYRNYGIKMIAVIHENLGAQEFSVKYWRGPVYLDEQQGFISAIGGGKPRWGSVVMSLFRPSVWGNLRRNLIKGIESDFDGEGRILGGLYVLHTGEQGIAYEHQEAVFGDHAPWDEVLAAAKKAGKLAKQMRTSSSKLV
ncbi:hypothetical protein H4R33_001304 [Dimargaris cristalligena]|uniref:Peroxiredoxin-like 2A n=1 Tax=Dimargaris cristalligena TaxID=215637 RepID=A0A4P9ZX82_9FUNG|nr:hypothetical protein H4R33_001304 [Dimargaris cristalligena]RKP37492.1 hypothetical protein BJ085DRAFT_38188 [Dimargaris cristalligena]|eukprot:RKP37492.1 hypothetical protein BJ085DRAFT_38188 [Dimargaris cristalligena]